MIACYDLEGVFVRTYSTIIGAARDVSGDSTNLGRAIKRGHMCKGFYWLKTDDPPDKYRPERWVRPGKKVNVYTRPMEFFASFSSIKDAAAALELDKQAVRKHARSGKWCKKGHFRHIQKDYFIEFVHPEDAQSTIHSIEHYRKEKPQFPEA